MKVIGKTTNSSETSVELDLFQGRKLSDATKERIQDDVGNFLVEQSIVHLSQAKSPVKGEGSFLKLSPDYAKKKKEEVGHARPNLEYDGDMQDEFDFEPTKRGIRIGIYGDRAPAADGHNNLSGKSSLPKRRFLPDEGQTYVGTIQKEVDRIIADAIAEETTFRASQFKGIKTKAALYTKLAEILGPMSRAELQLTVFRSDQLTDLLSDLDLLGLL